MGNNALGNATGFYDFFVSRDGAGGLGVLINGGKLWVGNAVLTVNPSTATLADNDTIGIEIDSTGTIVSHPGTTFTANAFPLAVAVTSGGVITTLTDVRSQIAIVRGIFTNGEGSPTGTTNTTGVFMGLGGNWAYFTPRTTGTVMVTIVGLITNNTAADGAGVTAYSGTENPPPDNGDALGDGAPVDTEYVFTNPAASTVTSQFTKIIILQDLTIGQFYWVDLVLRAITGGTASVSNVVINIVEF